MLLDTRSPPKHQYHRPDLKYSPSWRQLCWHHNQPLHTRISQDVREYYRTLTYATGEHIAFDPSACTPAVAAGHWLTLFESILEFIHTDSLSIHHILGWSTREQARKFAIEIYQILGDSSSLRLISLQDRAVTNSFYHIRNFPSQIESCHLVSADR